MSTAVFRAARTVGALALVTACAVALGACGSAGSSSSRLYVPAPATTKSVSNAEAEAAARESVALCKRAVAGATALPAAARSELEQACSKMLGLSDATAQELRKTICREVANASRGVESARERARQACELEARG